MWVVGCSGVWVGAVRATSRTCEQGDGPPQAATVDEKLASWVAYYSNIMVWSLPKVRKVPITLQPQAGLWDAYYSNITVLSLPKVRHGPPHAATVDQKLATWRHTTAISWSCVCKRFANVLPTLQQLTKSWPLGGIIQQYHGLEFAKSLPKSSTRCNS